MIKIKQLGGLAPVQADIDCIGYYGYFRARGCYISIEFAKSEDAWENDNIIKEYRHTTSGTNPYKASYYPKWKCKLFIYWSCLKFIIYKKF